MKLLVKRHDREFPIYRATAICQALAEAGHEVALECFHEKARIVEFAGVKWKHPHAPHAVGERRESTNPGDNPGKVIRPETKFFDHVIDLDGDGMFEVRWAALGRPWWAWAKEQAKAADPKMPFIADWPEVEVPPLSAQLSLPASFVLVAVLSEEAQTSGLNVAALEQHIGPAFPGARILWHAFHDFNFGPGREVLVAKSYPELAGHCRAAQAVFAVNGMAGAIARSFVKGQDRQRVAKRFCYIQTAPEHEPRGRPDPFAVIRGLLAAPPNPAQGGIVTFDPKLALAETQAMPAD